NPLSLPGPQWAATPESSFGSLPQVAASLQDPLVAFGTCGFSIVNLTNLIPVRFPPTVSGFSLSRLPEYITPVDAKLHVVPSVDTSTLNPRIDELPGSPQLWFGLIEMPLIVTAVGSWNTSSFGLTLPVATPSSPSVVEPQPMPSV